MMLGILWKKIYKDDTLRDTCRIVNTVHDSILFDIRPDVVPTATTLIMETLNNTAKFYEEVFGTPFSLPLTVECKVGFNWKDLT